MMRGYMELTDFMKHLADGILDYLPDDQRVGQLSIATIIEKWMAEKSYFSALSLRKDVASYINLQKSGDFKVDEILSWDDLCFIHERFDVEEHIFFTAIFGLIDCHVEKKRKSLLAKYFGWLGYR